jgi:hypothetical protein
MIMRLAAVSFVCTLALYSVAHGRQTIEQKRPQPSVDEIIQRRSAGRSESGVRRASDAGRRLNALIRMAGNGPKGSGYRQRAPERGASLAEELRRIEEAGQEH